MMYILGRFRRKFFNQIPENKDHYLRSRRAFTVDGITAMSILVLTATSYLNGFLEYIGVSPSINGIIAAVPALMGISQPFGAIIGQKIRRRKLFISAGAIFHRSMFTAMYVVPFFVKGLNAKIFAIVALYACGHFISALINPAASNWIISLSPQRVRGRYFSIREKYCILSASALGLLAGYILDYFKMIDDQNKGYIWMAIIIGVLTVINFMALSSIMEPESMEVRQSKVSIKDAFVMPFKEKSFRPIIIMGILFNLAVQMLIPYFGLYLVSDIKIPYVSISIIALMGGLLKAFLVPLWGKYADKTSWANVYKIAILILAFAHLFNIFLVPSTGAWYYLFLVMFSSISWSVIGIAQINIQYDYAPAKGRTLYVGSNGAITGIIGFLGVFFGAFVMEWTAKHQPMLFGMPVKGQQILTVFSAIMLFICFTYIHFVVEKNKKIINKTEGVAL